MPRPNTPCKYLANLPRGTWDAASLPDCKGSGDLAECRFGFGKCLGELADFDT